MNYRRLPGKHKGFFSTHTLWEADDHLLLIFSTEFMETYKRFYFEDIKAMTIRKTIDGKIYNAILLMCLCTYAAMVFNFDFLIDFWLLHFFGGFMLIILIANFIKGNTCAFHIHTNVQTEKIPSLNRINRAQKVIAHLRPLIEEAQKKKNNTMSFPDVTAI